MRETRKHPIQRASSNDLMALAEDTGESPMQVAAILVLDRTMDLEAVRSALTDRITAVPRLRQRLRRAPFGCGRPVWIDSAGFAISRHVGELQCPAPGDEGALLEVATAAAAALLPSDSPLWSITLVHGLTGQRSALILVMHHVLGDGVGGIATLAMLVDGAPAVPAVPFPAPAPTRRELLADATASRLQSLRSWPTGFELVRDAAAELTGGRVGHPSPSSLNQPTGPRRQCGVARADLGALASVAHRHEATINDVLLTAVAGALAAILRHRGESAETLVFSVPVSGRHDTTAPTLRNQVGVMLVEVSTLLEPIDQLAVIAARTPARGGSRGRGASAVLMEPLMRVLARFGAIRWFVNHQRMITTLVSNVHGPQTMMAFLGATVLEIIPISQVSGNVTISFTAMSYAGALAVTVIADPDHCSDLPLVVDELQSKLNDLTAALEPRCALEDGSLRPPASL